MTSDVVKLQKTKKSRLDQLLVEQGLAPTRARAQALVLSGKVFLNGVRADKSGTSVCIDAALEVRGTDHPYVSRGGVKLAGALDRFQVGVDGLRCLDLGASTGGFTDCLLQRGASFVAAVDVGYGQLAYSLRVDSRVLVLERTHGRTLHPEQIGGPVDVSVVDVSFIGLAQLLPALHRCTREGGMLVALVKPQFEVGRVEATKARGVIRDESLRAAVCARVAKEVQSAGFCLLDTCDSVLPGPKGNLEAFVYARRTGSPHCSGLLSERSLPATR